jgi:hypothetical protein
MNILTNILGILMTCVSVYALLYLDLSVVKFSILITIGLAAIYFENDTIKSYLKKAVDKLLR